MKKDLETHAWLYEDRKYGKHRSGIRNLRVQNVSRLREKKLTKCKRDTTEEIEKLVWEKLVIGKWQLISKGLPRRTTQRYKGTSA